MHAPLFLPGNASRSAIIKVEEEVLTDRTSDLLLLNCDGHVQLASFENQVVALLQHALRFLVGLEGNETVAAFVAKKRRDTKDADEKRQSKGLQLISVSWREVDARLSRRERTARRGRAPHSHCHGVGESSSGVAREEGDGKMRSAQLNLALEQRDARTVETNLRKGEFFAAVFAWVAKCVLEVSLEFAARVALFFAQNSRRPAHFGVSLSFIAYPLGTPALSLIILTALTLPNLWNKTCSSVSVVCGQTYRALLATLCGASCQEQKSQDAAHFDEEALAKEPRLSNISTLISVCLTVSARQGAVCTHVRRDAADKNAVRHGGPVPRRV